MDGLCESQILDLRRATEEVLNRTGVEVQHEGLLRLAARAGANVDESSGRVRIPPMLLEELLSQAPRQYEIAGAGGKRYRVGADGAACLSIVTDPWIIDPQTGATRRPCLEDIRRHTRIAQRMDEVVAISLMDYPVTDFPGPGSNLRAMEEHLLNHDKHIHVMPASEESLDRWLRVGRVLLGGGELGGSRLMTVGVAVRSPLVLTSLNAELLFTACKNDLPVVPTVCPMAGSTAPYSKAGTLLLGNAEIIALAALVQMVRPGHPYLYAYGPSRADMRTGEDLYYTLDKVLWKVAGVQLGISYDLPTAAECGGTMSPRYDLQSGAEGMLFMRAACGSGADLLAGIGSCGNAVTMSGEMMLVHRAWLQAARFL
jgi:trimethylamine---corrinoid protein Co-methyltransferase